MKTETPKRNIGHFFEHFAERVSHATGSSTAFLLATLSVIIWALTGPIFNYSENWQLVINTSTTIITFLMVFLIQKAQNKESLAVQLKLDELVAASKGASNRLVNVEHLTEEELETLHNHYRLMAELSTRRGEEKMNKSVEKAIKKGLDKVEDTVDETIEDVFKKFDKK